MGEPSITELRGSNQRVHGEPNSQWLRILASRVSTLPAHLLGRYIIFFLLTLHLNCYLWSYTNALPTANGALLPNHSRFPLSADAALVIVRINYP